MKNNIDIIDFHAHIIPGADHGSSSVAVTEIQLSSATEQGISRIIATPHFYPHRENVDRFIERRNACYEHLTKNLNRGDISTQIKLGAEVLICDNIEEMPMLDQLCICGTKALLIELPFSDFFDSYVYSVKSLIAQGFTVILAHADRYEPANIDRLVNAGAKIQLNADAISGLFVPKHIRKWLQNDVVYAIGSDIHGEDKKAHVRFNRAIKKLGDHIQSIKQKSDLFWN